MATNSKDSICRVSDGVFGPHQEAADHMTGRRTQGRGHRIFQKGASLELENSFQAAESLESNPPAPRASMCTISHAQPHSTFLSLQIPRVLPPLLLGIAAFCFQDAVPRLCQTGCFLSVGCYFKYQLSLEQEPTVSSLSTFCHIVSFCRAHRRCAFTVHLST